MDSAGVGKGATATVAFPPAQPDTPKMLVEQQRRVEKKRLLLVEDNPDIVEVLRLFLMGFSDNLLLTTARDGQEALELLTQTQYHLLVLDLMLPTMSGLDVMDRLKHLPKNKRTPVLILTGHADAAQKALEQGASDVLMKPFHKSTLLRKLLALLGLERRAISRPDA